MKRAWTSRPAVFLDRDGTLNEERSYITRPEQLRLLPGVPQALRRLRDAGFVCVIVTNQSAVGRRLMTEGDLARVHAELRRQLQAAGTDVDAIYHCPAAPQDDATHFSHPDRKPEPGMLLRASRDLHLDLAHSWMIGDTLRDLEAGRSAGCQGSLLVRCGHAVDESTPLPGPDCALVADLASAANHILASRVLDCSAA